MSSDYETAGNWSPSGVPNSSGANLIFGAGASTTSVTLSTPYPAGYVTVGSIAFNDPGSAYSVSVSNTAYLSVYGNVVNTSGITQNFSVTGDSATGAASEIILNGVNAGSNVVYTANAYGTIQINGATTVSSARFVLNGGAIAFSGSGVLALGPVSGAGILSYYGNPNGSQGTFQLGGSNDSTTLTAQIQEQTGTASVQKVGTGTLTLDGPSTYTGGTSLTSGGLLVGNDTALGTGNLSIATGTLFGSADGQPVALANSVTLAGGSETIDTAGGDLTLTGAITETGGAAALTKTGNNALILAADETYSGGTTISGGTLQLGNGGAAGSVLGKIVDNGTLNFDRSDNVQFGQVISGSGGVGQIGTGTVTLTAVNSFTGAVSVAAGGTLALSGAGSIATASGVNADGTFGISGATAAVSIKSLSGTGAVALGSQTLTLTQASGTFSGSINGTGGLTLSNGTEILTGANSYTGATRIAGSSTLQLGNGGATGSIAGNIVDSGTLAVNEVGTLAIVGAISGTGSVEKAGAGTLTLSGNNSYTGGTVVSAGTLSLTNNNSVGTGYVILYGRTTLALANGIDVANVVSISGDADLLVTNGSATDSGVLRGNGRLAKTGVGKLVLTGISLYVGGTTISAGTLQVGNSGATGFIAGDVADNGALVFDHSDDISFAGAVSGTGRVEQDGSASLTLTGNSSYSGGTALNTGTLVIGSNNAIGTGALTMAAGTALGFSGNFTLANQIIASGDPTLQVNSGNVVTLAGTIANGASPGDIVKTGTGTLVLTGTNTYSGGTTISAGTLQLGNGGTAGSIVGNVVDNGILAVNRSNDLTIAGAISGTGSVEKAGTGTLTLSGNNNYSGGTVVAAGTLSLITDQSAGTGAITLGDGTALALADGLNVTNALSISGNVNLIVANGSAIESGVLSGSGTYTLSGGGTLHMTGDNGGFSGTTVLSGLTVDLATDSALGAGSAEVVGKATLHYENGIVIVNAISVTTGSLMTADVSTGTSATQAGAITGNGSLAKTGAGTFVLAGNNLYTGGTTISGGTLQLGKGGTTGTIVGDVANSGVLVFDRSDDIAFAGAVSGTGRVEQDGTGSLTLTGNSNYSGGTALNTGILVVGNANAIGTGALSMAAGTTLGFGGNFTLANAITVSGDPTLRVGTGIVATASGVISDGATAGDIVKTGGGTLVLTGTNTYSAGTTISAGALQLGNGGATGSIVGNVVDNGTLAFDRSDAVAFGSQISGSGTLRQSGTGTLTLSGNDAAFTGNTVVASGTLSVNGTLGGSIAVDSGATLAGTGTVGSTMIASGGTLSPAGAGTIGTLTVKGNLSLASGSTYLVDAGPAGSADLVHATGTAILSGGNVASVAATGNWLVSTRYTILTADAGVGGKFGSVTSNFAFLTPTLSYDGNDVYLTLLRNNVDFASLATTRNQRAVGNGLTSLAGGPLANAVVQLSTSEAPSAFNQLSGEFQASVKSVLLDDSRFVRDAGIDRIRSAFGGFGASTASVSTYTDGNAAAAAATVDGPAFWTQGYGFWGHDDSDGNAAKATHSTGGFLVGADAPVADGWRAGLLGGYGRTTFDASGSGTSDNYSLGVYGGNQWGGLGLRVGMAYSWNDIDTRRAVAFTGFRDSLSAGYSAQTVQGFGDLGYKLPVYETWLGQVAMEPFVGLAYVGLHADAFTERGAAAALSAVAQDAGEVFSTLGLRASDGFALGSLQLTAIGTAGWRHTYNDVAQTSTLRFVGSNDFTVAGVPIARDAALIEAGLSTDVTQAVSLSVTYTGQFGNGTEDQGVRGTIAWKF